MPRTASSTSIPPQSPVKRASARIAPSVTPMGENKPLLVVARDAKKTLFGGRRAVPTGSTEELKRLAGIKKTYTLVKQQRGLAYGTPDSPIYGENTEGSMAAAFEAMGLGEGHANVFCDVGAGSGAPSLHCAAAYPNVTSSYGIELMGSRWWISQSILLKCLKDEITKETASKVMLAHADLNDLRSFGPITHLYAFDTGFPKSSFVGYVRAFNASRRIRVFASFQSLKKLEEAGFEGLHFKQKVPMRMFGSKEGKSLNVFTVDLKEIVDLNNENGLVVEEIATSWNVTRVCAPPTGLAYVPSVVHSESYAAGEECRLQGLAQYETWVSEQVGLDRSTRCTRAKAKLRSGEAE